MIFQIQKLNIIKVIKSHRIVVFAAHQNGSGIFGIGIFRENAIRVKIFFKWEMIKLIGAQFTDWKTLLLIFSKASVLIFLGRKKSMFASEKHQGRKRMQLFVYACFLELFTWTYSLFNKNFLSID